MFSTDDMTKEQRVEYWEMVIDEFSTSELTKTDYCRKNEIPVSTFNYWLNRLEDLKQAAETSDGRFVEVPHRASEGHPVHESSFSAFSFIPEIALEYEDHRILINASTSTELLSSVLHVLGHA